MLINNPKMALLLMRFTETEIIEDITLILDVIELNGNRKHN